jgi:hypothetical protein
METLIIYKSQIMGKTDQILNVGDIVSIQVENSKDDTPGTTPFVVNQVLRVPKTIGFNPNIAEDPTTFTLSEETDDSNYIDVEWDQYKDYDFIAYLSYNEKATSKYIKKTSQKLEKRMAKSLGGQTTPGSGAFDGHKGDVKSKTWLGEHKFTDAMFYRLTLEKWQKIASEAFQSNRTPIFEVVLDQSDSHVRLIFMELHDFYEKTRATEEEFVKLFFVNQLKSRKNSSGITLRTNEIKQHVNETYAKTATNIPGWFLTFTDKITLFGLRAKDFERIFSEND